MAATLAIGLSTTAFAYAEEHIVRVTESGFEGTAGAQGQSYLAIHKGDTVTFINTDMKANGNLEPHCISDPFAVPYTELSCWIIDNSTPSRSYTLSENQTFYDRFSETGPIIVNIVENIQAGVWGDGTLEVHTYEYPFKVTVVEGGKIVVHNESRMNYEIEHTQTTGTEKGGTFSLFVGANSTGTLHLPIDNCSSCYPAGVYYFEDDNHRHMVGTITIVHPEDWFPSVNEEVGIQETVVVVVKSQVEETPILSGNVTTSISSGNIITTNTNNTGIYNVPEFTGTYDVLKLQQQLAQVTSDYTNALETIGSRNSEIRDLEGANQYLKASQIELADERNTIKMDHDKAQKDLQTANEKLAKQQVEQTKVAELNNQVYTLKNNVDLLEQQKAEITKERDNWKQLADNWYAIALEQLRVMTNVLGL